MNVFQNLKTIVNEIQSSFNFPKEIEKEYRKFSYPQSIVMMRLAIVLGASIHLSFFWLDALMFPDNYYGVWLMRIVVLFIFFVILPLTFQSFFAKIHQAALFFVLLIITIGQFYALILTNSEEGSTLYYTGLLLVIASAYALSQMNLRNCIFLNIIMMFGYLWVGVFHMGWVDYGWLSEKGLLLINNFFFLFSMSVIGVVTYITIHYFRRKGFLSQILAEEERKKVAIERLRIKISSDLHDDVGSILSGLSMQTEILEQTASEDEKIKLQRIGELSRRAMSRMRDAVWAMDARKDKWESLQDRMREFAEETLGEKEIAYHIEFDNLDLQKQLPAEIRQNLYLIFKEAVTNIVKHSNATKVQVSLKNIGAAFEMFIRDNGVSSKKNRQRAGLGLSNMKMRAEQIQATFQCYDKDGFNVYLSREKI